MKTATSKLHLEIFDSNRLTLWHQLKPFRDVGVLAGGTALALQLGHRKSYDFDIFTYTAVKPALLERVNRVLGGHQIQVITDLSTELTLSIDGIGVTFFHDPFPKLYPVLKTEVFDLLDYQDIASHKCYVVGRRGRWRDYVDIYWLLCHRGLDINLILRDTEKKFGGNFSRRLFFQQLTYWKDIEEMEVDFLKLPISSKEIQDYLESLVETYTTII